MTDERDIWLYTYPVDGCVEVRGLVNATLFAPRLEVTYQQTSDDDHVGTDVDTQRQHVRAPEHIRVLGGQNTAGQIHNNKSSTVILKCRIVVGYI